MVTPHRLRHSFACELEASGAGLVLIQELLGHRQITSTQVYVQPGAAALRAAVERAYSRYAGDRRGRAIGGAASVGS